jgi:Rod binding domain-containing protein
MSAIDPVGGPTPPSQRARLLQAAQELESVFYAQLFQAMRATIPAEGGLLESSTGEQMFTAMLDDQVARMATTRHESELASAMARQLGRNLPPEGAAASAAPAAGSGNDRGR